MKAIFRVALLALLCHVHFMTHAQWQTLHPGAGGRLQGMSADPTVKGRLFACSDMEGYYVSDDYGRSWKHGSLTIPTSWVCQVEGRGNTIWAGHALGLSKSTNKGSSWKHINITKNRTIGMVELDPRNQNRIFAGINWMNHETIVNKYPQQKSDERVIFWSLDGGNSWKKKAWVAGNGEPRVWSIQVNPTNSNEVMVANNNGLYRFNPTGSGSFTKINGPAGADGVCRGADYTPDGKWLYALYKKGGVTHIFARNLANNGGWVDLGSGSFSPSNNFWYPKVYGGSTANKHYLLIGQYEQNPNVGLYEGTFTTNGNNVSGSVKLILNYSGPNNSYDIGWNPYVPNCRNFTYFPFSWKNTPFTRGVFTQSQQSYFIGDASNGNNNWLVNSTFNSKTIAGKKFYSGRGTASTFNYSSAKSGNYIIQGMADNCALESYDNGLSWRQFDALRLYDGHMTYINPGNPEIVFMSAAAVFGGGSEAANAVLVYKKMVNKDPTDQWKQIVSANNKRGLPRNRVHHMVHNPNNTKQVYALTHAGLYYMSDIRNFVDGNQNWVKVNTPVSSRAHNLVFDPNNNNIVYYKADGGTYRGTGSGSSFNWVQMKNTTGTTNKLHKGDVVAVKKGNKTFVYNYQNQEGIVRGDGGSDKFNTMILTETKAMDILGRPVWFRVPKNGSYLFNIATDGNSLFATYGIWDDVRKGYGILKGTVANNGNVTWTNWTGDNIFSITRDMQVHDNALYLSTQGNGLVRRAISGSLPALPSAPPFAWPAPPPPGNGDGLKGEYFTGILTADSNAVNFGSKILQRVDDEINFNWEFGSPANSVPNQLFAVRWTGQVQPLYSQTYTFSTNTDDGVRLWVNGKLLVDKWQKQGPTEWSGTITLQKDKKYDIKMEYFERFWTASAQLFWSSSSQQKSIIPVQRLFSTGFSGGGEPSNVPVTGVNLTPANATLNVGGTRQLTATVAPANASNKGVSYQSSKPSVATVNGSGLVTAIAAGTANITVTTNDGGKTDVTSITVNGSNPDPDPDPDPTCSNADKGNKPAAPCEVTAVSLSATSARIEWTDNSNVANRYQIQRFLTGDKWRQLVTLNNGNATSYVANNLTAGGEYRFRVKARSSNSGSSWTESAKITLGGGGGGPTTVPVTGVTMNPANVSLTVGGTRQLSVSVAPNNATNKSVSYSSSNNSVASVSNSGLVTAQSAGSAVITVTTQDGGRTDVTNVSVTGGGSNGGNETDPVGSCSATSSGNKPNPPCEVYIEATSSNSVILHWNDNSNNEDFFDIMAFRSGDTWRAGGMPDGGKNAESVAISNLVSGAKYRFRIKAKSNSNGASAWVVTEEIDLGASARFALGAAETKSESLILFPNPSQGQVTIESSKNGQGFIVNALGQKVMNLNISEGQNQIDLSGFRSGVYMFLFDNGRHIRFNLK